MVHSLQYCARENAERPSVAGVEERKGVLR